MYMSESEIVDHMMLYGMLEPAKRDLRAFKREDLITLHGTVGRWIRNTYALWDDNNPHMVYDAKDPNDPNHPDQMSMRIIETVWARLQ